MTLRMFRSATPLKELEKGIDQYIDLFKKGDFNDFLSNQKYYDIDTSFTDRDLDELIHSNNAKDDLENSLLVWEKIKVSPRIAREARFWVTLTIGPCLSYVRARYPFAEDETENKRLILNKFLVPNDKRGLDRENALSRLWMSSYVASKVDAMELEVALSVLLHQTDFREQVIGRPTVLKSRALLNAVMHTAKRILLDENDKSFFARKNNDGGYKRWLAELNLEGGTRLLDALEKSDLHRLVNDLADQQR